MMKKVLLTAAFCLGAMVPLYAQTPASQDQTLAQNTSFSLTANYLQDDALAEPLSAPQSPYRERRSRNLPEGKNVLTGSPVNLVVVNDYACYAFGFTYEHLFGPEEILGIQIPMHFAFGSNDWLDGDDGHFFYTAPGLQVHVAGAHRKFDYAVGPSVILGNLNERIYRGNNPDYHLNTFTTGVMVDNNLNFQRRHFLFGIHMAFGTTFPNDSYDSQFFMQFGFRFGGRF